MIFYAYFIQNEKLIFEIEEITNWMNAGHSPPKRHVVKKMIRKRLATRGPTPKVIELQLLLMSIIIYLYTFIYIYRLVFGYVYTNENCIYF